MEPISDTRCGSQSGTNPALLRRRSRPGSSGPPIFLLPCIQSSPSAVEEPPRRKADDTTTAAAPRTGMEVRNGQQVPAPNSCTRADSLRGSRWSNRAEQLDSHRSAAATGVHDDEVEEDQKLVGHLQQIYSGLQH